MPNFTSVFTLLDRQFTGSSILGKRIFLRSLVIMLVITSIALVLQFFIETRNRDEEQLKDLNHTIDALIPSLAGSVWQLNDRSIETLLASLTTRPEVLYATMDFDFQFIGVVEGEEGLGHMVYNSEVSFAELKMRCDQKIEKDLSLDRSADGVEVEGHLFVCYVRSQVDSVFLLGTLTQYLPHLLAIVLASALFVMMVVRTVVKPLSDITRGLGAGGSILDLQVRADKAGPVDEIDQLINELKNNTSRLLKERGITDAALMRIAEGVAITDEHFNILRANSGLKTILLGDTDEIKINNLQSVVPVPLSNTVGESIEFEANNDRVLEVFGTKIESLLDETEYVFLIRDLTQKRRLLEESVQAQKLRALDTFAGGLAHDFNNILMIINGNLELCLLTETEKSPNSRYLDVALKAVQNGQKLTNKLLAFSRKQQFSSRFIAASDIGDSITNLVKGHVDPAINLTICVNSSRTVFVDPPFLESALLNLILNACDALPQGGEMTLSIQDKIIDGKIFVEFSVADNGTGITSSDLQHVCTPFFTTKDVGKGTGLGLSMVLGFAEQSGGKFDISSEVGIGTIASILLPAHSETVNASSSERNDKIPFAAKNVVPMCILVVDDNRHVCGLLKRQIENFGHSVIVAHSVEELRTPVLSELLSKVELVICDVVLEGETVLDVHQYLSECGVHTPLVLISGNVPKSLDESIKRLNYAEVIRKPFSIEKLKSVIESVQLDDK